jgi:ribosome maturation factor RimP
MEAEETIGLLVNNLLENDPAYFLVEVKIKPTNNVKVFIDADNGASIDKLAGLNRALYKNIIAKGLFPEDNFSLEVSSPGLEQPLKNHRQYQKNIGRKIEAILLDGQVHTGLLQEVTEDHILLEESFDKKKEKKQITIPLKQIKYTKVCIVF